MPIHPALGYFFISVIGKLIRDVILTREEIHGLMENLLYTDASPVGKTKLTDWAIENSKTLGINYASELVRRKNRLLE